MIPLQRHVRYLLNRIPMNQNIAIPVAIVVAGAIIAGALFFAGRSAAPNGPNPNNQNQTVESVPDVSAEDHILGNPDAPIVIVEYSDIECPFCKQFHITMQQIMEEYGKDGQVAWVYRHFPLAQLHPNAPRLAEASECVAELAGEDAFWNFLDEVFAVAPGNNSFPLNRLTETAAKVGTDSAAFDSCLASGRHQATIEGEFNEAIASGGQGTPHNILIVSNGEKIPVAGAQPYATMKSVIETILSEIGAN